MSDWYRGSWRKPVSVWDLVRAVVLVVGVPVCVGVMMSLATAEPVKPLSELILESPNGQCVIKFRATDTASEITLTDPKGSEIVTAADLRDLRQALGR